MGHVTRKLREQRIAANAAFAKKKKRKKAKTTKGAEPNNTTTPPVIDQPDAIDTPEE